jgi:hypothetical protein
LKAARKPEVRSKQDAEVDKVFAEAFKEVDKFCVNHGIKLSVSWFLFVVIDWLMLLQRQRHEYCD